MEACSLILALLGSSTRLMRILLFGWSAGEDRILMPYFLDFWSSLRRYFSGGRAADFRSLSILIYRGRPVIIQTALL